jgi:hypothetical protein
MRSRRVRSNSRSIIIVGVGVVLEGIVGGGGIVVGVGVLLGVGEGVVV